MGALSLGFLRQPDLRKALHHMGWAVVPGVGPSVDAIGVWGRRPVSARGRHMARWRGLPLITLEDGFLRSVHPGPGAPIISLIADDVGTYYDASAPSRLEALIRDQAGDPDRAAAAWARIAALGLSKYNAAPALDVRPEGHVLVIDQTRDDASIRFGGADANSFARMLAAARAEHPGAEIIIKTHPETQSGRKSGHFTDADAGGNVRLWRTPARPLDLIAGARAVYTVTSQMGAEALFAGRPVRCFGMPFYAGWQATVDEIATPSRRGERRCAMEIFAAAYLAYPTYFDPWRGGVSTLEAAISALALFRDHDMRTRPESIIMGVRLWKRGHVASFLNRPCAPVRFVDDPARAARKAAATGGRVVAWAGKATPDATATIAAAKVPLARLEDGFLRSVGLGAALTPPLSLSLDEEGIYYDPRTPSRMERLIAAAPSDPASLARAAALRADIIRLNITKYNLRGDDGGLKVPQGRRVILVPGQVEDDASILTGAGEVATNLALLTATRKAAPDAFIIYKPHPDVEAGLRPGTIDPAALTSLCDVVARQVPAAAVLPLVSEVWTMTSLLGFEALLRGVAVTCFGAPFYAGWGLTDDRGDVPARRQARPSVDQLVHSALIAYPIYRDPVSGLICPPEVIVERLSAGIGGARGGGRLLSKAQGLLAGFTPLWR